MMDSDMQKFRNIYQPHVLPGEKYLEDVCHLSMVPFVRSANF